MKALLWPDGRLTDISHSTEASEGADLVEVDEMPAGFGPHAYDPETRHAIPHTGLIAARDRALKIGAALKAQERLDGLAKLQAAGVDVAAEIAEATVAVGAATAAVNVTIETTKE